MPKTFTGEINEEYKMADIEKIAKLTVVKSIHKAGIE